jgi:hypothetical protein
MFIYSPYSWDHCMTKPNHKWDIVWEQLWVRILWIQHTSQLWEERICCLGHCVCWETGCPFRFLYGRFPNYNKLYHVANMHKYGVELLEVIDLSAFRFWFSLISQCTWNRKLYSMEYYLLSFLVALLLRSFYMCIAAPSWNTCWACNSNEELEVIALTSYNHSFMWAYLHIMPQVMGTIFVWGEQHAILLAIYELSSCK